MFDISMNQTFETSSNSIAIDNVKTKIEIIVASKTKFSINAKIEIIVASKIEFFNVEINAYNQTLFFERIDKKQKHYKIVSSFEIHFFNLHYFCNHLQNDSNSILRISINSIETFQSINSFQSISSIESKSFVICT